MTGMTGMAGGGAGFTVSADLINGFGNRLSARAEAVNTAAASLGMVEVTPDMFGPAAHERGFTTAVAQTTQRITDLFARSAEAIENAAVGTKKSAADYAATEEQNTAGLGEENFGFPGAMPPGGNTMSGGASYGGGMDPMPVVGGFGPSVLTGMDPMSANGIVGPPILTGMDQMPPNGIVGPSVPSGMAPSVPGGGIPAFIPPEVPLIGANLPGAGGPTSVSSTGGVMPGLTDPSSVIPQMPPMPGDVRPPLAPQPQMPQPQPFIPPMPQLPTTPPASVPNNVRNEAPEQWTPPHKAWSALEPPKLPERPATQTLPSGPLHKEGPVAPAEWTPPSVPDPPELLAAYRTPAPLDPEPVTDLATAGMPSVPAPLPAVPPPDFGTGGGGGPSSGGSSVFSGGPGLGSVPPLGVPANMVSAAPSAGATPSGAMPTGVGPVGMPSAPGGPAGMPPMGGMGAGSGQGGDQERKSAGYLKGEDVFQPPEGNPPPPVIGGAPPKHHDPAPPSAS
jgi:hypothetical protein